MVSKHCAATGHRVGLGPPHCSVSVPSVLATGALKPHKANHIVIRRLCVNDRDELIEDTLEVLWRVREEVHGHVEDSVILQLDAAINLLEAAQYGDPGEPIMQDIVTALGKIIELLPTVAKLLEYLSSLE